MLKLNEISNKMKLLVEGTNERDMFETYAGAVLYAKEMAEKRGYEIDEDDWHREITTGPGKPGADMPQLYEQPPSVRHSIGLIKNGKPQRKALHIIVTYLEGRGYPYELVHYIN